jgi:hypothetical protein
MMLRYTHPETGRTFLIEIARHLAGRFQFYTYRLVDGVPGRQRSQRYRHYLDALRAALQDARGECSKPAH